MSSRTIRLSPEDLRVAIARYAADFELIKPGEKFAVRVSVGAVAQGYGTQEMQSHVVKAEIEVM